MQQVLTTFSIDEDTFHQITRDTTKFIQSYFELSPDDDIRYMFSYLYLLHRPSIHTYLQFGADKCYITNFDEFCHTLDIANIGNGLVEKKNGQIKTHYYNKTHTLIFTYSMGYFGISGEYNKVLDAFDVFLKTSSYDSLCWGKRDYI
jgi:hypothetical protein